jgi:hypothetical protein
MNGRVPDARLFFDEKTGNIGRINKKRKGSSLRFSLQIGRESGIMRVPQEDGCNEVPRARAAVPV